ncbi:hypothetical protein [Pseudooceanicola aestuarii]|uniref:hypothetical protein n=1 Tax=Pseudooceanicola aestuarii TaxID=2697319 RepID=UPI0019542F86|nr:hypothetical protein [Pseudooceanicola aestuarii]
MTGTPWTFDRLTPGQCFGPVTIPLDETRQAGWRAIYGAPEGETAPDGLIVAGMMEAFIRAIQPRPRGNVHAGQTLALTGATVRLGEDVTYHVSVAARDQKRGRNWITCSVRAEAGGRALLRGDITTIWAA